LFVVEKGDGEGEKVGESVINEVLKENFSVFDQYCEEVIQIGKEAIQERGGGKRKEKEREKERERERERERVWLRDR